jgi:sugar O-acyltransferase (sialic acid O-acetyltransferase NeuD family)
MRVALFAVGSAVTADVEESCARAGWTVTMAIRNFPGPNWASEEVPLAESGEVSIRDPVLLPLFSPANRRAAWADAVARGAAVFPALIDPTAILPRRIAIAEGVYVNAGCVIGAGSRLGRFVFINRAASLGHHADVGDFASVGPGVTVAGGVTIGAGAMLGAGAVVLPNVRIGADAVIGAGCVVRHDVPAGGRFVG